MSKEKTALQNAQQVLGEIYQLGNNCVYLDTDDGCRVEVTVVNDNVDTPRYNVCLMKQGEEIGRTADVAASNLRDEVDTLCFLACVK